MIDNVLYLSTPYNRVVALDAETGARALGVRSESVRGRSAAERHRLRASRRGRVARHRERQQAADLHQQPLSPDLPRRGDGRAGRVVRRGRRRRSQPRAWSGRSRRSTTRTRRRRSSTRTSSSSATASAIGSSTATIRRATSARSTRAPASRSGRFHTIPQPGEVGQRHVAAGFVELHRATPTCGRR